MHRIWLGIVAALVGAACLAAAQLAEASRTLREGGIFRYGTPGASVQIDPQLAYVSTAWWLEYATALKLFNYPDLPGRAGAQLEREAVARYGVSRDGRTWTFVIRRGFRFSDGLPVTAASFKRAIDRAANHMLASPGASFIMEPGGTNIVGAKRANDGLATRVSGVTASGYRLVIRLARRDPALPSVLAMPFFQATPARLPLTREVTGGYPSAGPYFFSRNDPNVTTELRRNPYYRGARPRNLRGLEVRWNLDEEAAYRQVHMGALDETALPGAHADELARAYGLNRSRFWAKPTSCIGMVALNNQRPLFRGNAALRQALNWVVDRRAYAATAGPYAQSPWTHFLPPTLAGAVTARKLQPYAGAPDLQKARRLAAGHLRRGRITIGYRSSGPTGTAIARLLRRDLLKLGIAAVRIKLKPFSGADLYAAMGQRNTDLDLGAGIGWCSDYLEPASLLRQALGASSIGDVSAGRYRSRLEAALGRGPRALGRLDVEVTKKLAPAVVLSVYNNRYFFSARVDPRSLVYENAYGDWSIPALALK